MICSVCGIDKTAEEFAESRKKCRKCRSEEGRALLRTKEGVIRRIYSSQKTHSKSRGHQSPAYSHKELSSWMLAQPRFHTLYDEWVNSSYKKELKPSVDRIVNSEHYCLGNIQLMTWAENKKKGHEDSKTHQLSTGEPKLVVAKLSLAGEILDTYISIRDAARANGMHASVVHDVCRNRAHHKTAGGFKWAYLDVRNYDGLKVFGAG